MTQKKFRCTYSDGKNWIKKEFTLEELMNGECFEVTSDQPLLKHFIMKDTYQWSGIKDKNGIEVYDDDLLSDGKKSFRVYHVEGGFVIKAYAWINDKKDLVKSDELIYMPIADVQTKGYIQESCYVIGTAYENPELL